MPSARFETVEAYLAAQPESARVVLARVRTLVRRAIPTAEECISYNIPAYKLPAGTVIYFAGWKRHYSLYPVNERILEACGGLGEYEFEKGTIRFPLDQPVPSKLITAITKLRAQQVQAPRTKSPTKPKTTKTSRAAGTRRRAKGTD
jgi:uncharacterized protein YdhG (YjbR/CyaY superfamily)